MNKANDLLRQWLHMFEGGIASSPLSALRELTRSHLKDADSFQLIVAGSSRQAAHIAKAKGVQRYTYIACGEGLRV